MAFKLIIPQSNPIDPSGRVSREWQLFFLDLGNAVVGSGTVTHTSGDLTAGLPVIGNGGADIAVLPPSIDGYVLTQVAGVAAWTAAGSGISELTGDVTAGPGSGSQAASLALAVPHHWTAVQGSTYETLTDAATITPVGSTNVSYLLCTNAVGATRTINVPTFANGTASDYFAIEVEQPATGGPCAVVFAPGYTWGKGGLDSQPFGSTTAGSVDSYFFQKKHNGNWHGNQIGQAGPTGANGANGSGSPTGISGRLTLTSGVPVTTANVTAATTVYFTPYGGNNIVLWDGAAWTGYSYVETALALGTLTAGLPYDVFGRQVAGVLALDLLAWSSASARATAVTIQDGRWCKSGDKTRLLLGTFYTASTTTTEDSTLRRYVSNVFNAVPRELAVREAAASSTYSSATPRQANANAGNQVEAVFSVPGNSIDVSLLGIVSNNVSTTGGVSIGEDSTVASSPSALSGYPTYTGGNVSCGVTTRLCKQPTPGWHRYVWLESCSSAAAITFTYSNATSTGNMVQTGLQGRVEA